MGERKQIIRIEFRERHEDIDKDEMEELKNIFPNNWEEQIEVAYRRTNPRVDDIDRIAEIPGNDNECVVLFIGGYSIVVQGNYDDLCIELNDRENGDFSEHENY